MKKPIRKDELADADLQKMFSRQGRLSTPASLDERILSAAAKAVESENAIGETESGKSYIWQKSIAVAATIVISVSVFSLFYKTQQDRQLFELSVDQQTQAIGADSGSGFKGVSDDGVEVSEEALGSGAIILKQHNTSPQSNRLSAPSAMPESMPLDIRKASAERDYRQSPESWIVYIEELQFAGSFDDAEYERRLFSEKYPDHEFSRPLTNDGPLSIPD